MARKRVNRKFLILIGVGLMMVLAGAFAYKYRHRILRGSPEKYMARARQAMEQGDYAEASKNLGVAYSIYKTPNPEICVMLGDCSSYQAMADQGNSLENIARARQYWMLAVSIDPEHVPALQRIFKSDQERARISPIPKFLDDVRDSARKLAAADPTDREARKTVHSMLLQRWLSGVQVDRSEVDEALEALSAMMKEDPTDPDPPYYIIASNVARSEEARRQRDDATAKQLLDEAIKMQEEVIAAQPDNPAFAFSRGEIYRYLARPGRKIAEEERLVYEQRMRESYDRARQVVKPDHPRYLDIMVRCAQVSEQDKKPAEAEQILRELMAEKPYEQGVRVELAKLLVRDRARRQDAVELLSQPPVVDPKASGFAALRAKEAQAVTLLELLKARLEVLPEDPQQRAAQFGELDEIFSKLSTYFSNPEDPNILGIRGRLEMVKGDSISALQTLTRAVRTMENNPSERTSLMLLLAQANMNAGQSGEAKKLLQRVLADYEDFTPARIQLVALLLLEKRTEEAKKEIERLKTKLTAQNPLVITLEMSTLDPEKDKEQLRKLFEQLPETSLAERVDKARAALNGMQDYAQAIRLLESVQAERPDDIELTVNIAQLYDKKGQKDKAIQIVQDALNKHPGSIALQAFKRQLVDASPEQMKQFRSDVVEGIKDPLTKELLQAETARDEDRLDDMFAHLAAAEKIKANDLRVMELLFQANIGRKDWEKASQYMEKLASANADRSGGLNYRIYFALARGDMAQAMEKAQQLTRDFPEFARSWQILGKVQQSQGSFADAVGSYQFALERQPTNLEALRGLIECSYSLNRPDDAQRYINRGRQLAPNNIPFREMGFLHEQNYGDPETVIPPRQALLKENPENVRAWYSLVQSYFAAARKKASVGDDAAASERYAKARDTALQAFKKWPDDNALAQVLGEIAVRTKNFADGEQAIRALMARPKWKDRIEPTIMLVDYYTVWHKPVEAEKALRALLVPDKPNTALQLRLADLLVQQKKVDEALELLPANSPEEAIRAKRIIIEVQAGRLDAAQKDLDTAMAAGKTPAMLNLQALLYERMGRLPDTLAVLDQILKLDPRNASALTVRGRVRAKRGDLAGALTDLIASRDLQPDNMQTRLAIADAYRASGDHDAAVRELESAIRLDPLDRTARINLLDLYSRAEPPRWTQVEELFREVHDSPQLAKDPVLLHAEGVVWMKRNDPAKAMKFVREALDLAPNDPGIARTFFDILIVNKQYKDMLQNSEKLAKARTDLWWLYQQRGVARVRMEDKDGGLAEFESALKAASDQHDDGAAAAIVRTIADEIGVGPAMVRVEPRAEKDNRWKIFAAMLCQGQGDIRGALKWVEAALAQPNLTPEERNLALRMAGTFYAQLNPPDIGKSTAAFQKLLEQHPDSIEVLNNLACVMIMPGATNSPQEALKYSQRAYELMQQTGNTMDPAVLDTHGSILVLVGQVDEGINLLRDALDRRQFADAYYHLGDAYLRKSQPDDAEKALKSAQDLVAQAEREKQQVDPTLKAKIEEALSKVAPMRQQKAASGGGNG